MTQLSLAGLFGRPDSMRRCGDGLGSFLRDSIFPYVAKANIFSQGCFRPGWEFRLETFLRTPCGRTEAPGAWTSFGSRLGGNALLRMFERAIRTDAQ